MAALKYRLQRGFKSMSSTYLVHGRDVVRRLEAEGFTSSQAEAITQTLLQVLQNTAEKDDKTFTKKIELDTIAEVNQDQLAKMILKRETYMDGYVKCMGDKIRKHYSDVEEEKERAVDDAAMQLRALEREHMEKMNDAKYDVIKYTVGTLLSIATFSFAIVCLFK